MADVITPAFGLVKMEDGSHNNTWGDVTNNNLQRIEDRLTLSIPVAITGTTITLTETQQKIAICFEITGTLGGDTSIVFSETGLYLVRNSTAGNFALYALVAGQTITTQIMRGETMILYCDGSKIVQVGRDLRAGFSAVMTFDQAIPHGVNTGIAMQGVLFNRGSYYIGANSSWSPPQGVAMMNFSWTTTQGITGNVLTVIMKDGVPYKWTSTNNDSGGHITLIEPTFGTSYYQPSVFCSNPSDILVVMGAGSWWQGHMLD